MSKQLMNLPSFIACAFIHSAADLIDEYPIFGNGFVDFTKPVDCDIEDKVSSWLENKENLLRELKKFETILHVMRFYVETEQRDQLTSFLEKASTIAERLRS